MASSMIEAAVDGEIGRITLNDPATHNALTQAAMREMTALLERWADRPELRVIVLTGRGRRFCAGAALADVATADWTDNPLTRLCDTLEAMPAPTIAALNGGVWGAGVDLALACDFRVGAHGVRACVPPARLGIHYAPEGIARAVDRLGSQMARRMFLLAETFDDAALLAAGFLDQLVPPEALEARVADLGGALAGLAPLAVRGMKRTILEVSRGALDRAAARDRIAACFASQDHAEGLAAQRERRPPRFTGR